MENFILILKKDKRLGYLIVPWIVEKHSMYHRLRQIATVANTIGTNISQSEKQILKLTEEYEEHMLNRVFDNRHLTVKEFWRKLEDDKIKDHIRPYIENRLVKIFNLLQQSPVTLFLLPDPNEINVYPDKKLTICTDATETIFNFSRQEDGTQYFLTLHSGNQEIHLFGKKGFILAKQPCLICIENRVMLFKDIDGKKLMPFFQKENIAVPQRMEDTYYSGFIKNSLEKYHVNATGFEIIEELPEKRAVLNMETDFLNEYQLILTFRYGEKTIRANETKQVFVRLEKENSQYRFFRWKRDLKWEEQRRQFLIKKNLPELSKGIFKTATEKKGEEQKTDFVTEVGKIALELQEQGFELIQDLYQKEYFIGEIDLYFQQSKKIVQTDFFGMRAIVQLGDFQIPFIQFRKHILNGLHEYKLPDGKVAVLPENWFTDYRDLLRFSEKKGDEMVIRTIHIPLLEKKLEIFPQEIVSKYRQLMDAKNNEAVPLPKSLEGVLRSYQKEGFFWFKKLERLGFGACLADDMGLGKTLQTITLLLQNRDVHGTKIIQKKEPTSLQVNLFSKTENDWEIPAGNPNLIVAPKSLLFNWIEEFTKFAPAYKVKIADQAFVQQIKRETIEEYDALLITYGMLRRHVDKLKAIPFDTMVLDESQNIKNPGSATYQAVIQCKAKQRIILTGTPVENSLIDLWAQMNFINPGLLGSLPFFKKQYVTASDKLGGEVRIKKLSSLLYPFLMRRTKAEVEKDLPSRTIQQVNTEMSDEQKAFYDKIRIKTRNALLELLETKQRNKSSILILQGISKLRLAANHPILTDKEYEFSSGKFEQSIDLLNTLVEEKHKVLVFSSFVKHLELYAQHFNEQNILYEILTGKDSLQARQKKVTRFQGDEECRIFLISLKAGGTGLNLTAADYVVLLDPWWNPAAERQAIDRTHRIGQDKKIFVYKMISKGTIEEKIFLYQQRKTQLAEDIFATDEGVLKNLSDDDIRELFQ